MIKRLRLKFIAVNMTLVTVMLCIILGLVYHFTRSGLEAENLHMMENIAQSPFALGSPDEPDGEVRLPYFVLRISPDGELVTTGGGYYDLSNHAFLNKLIEKVFSSAKPFGVLEQYHLRYYRLDHPANRCIVFSDISSELSTLRTLTRNCALIGGISFLLFLAVSILLSRWAVRPVELALKQQKQFAADASHELKTPLTVIMTNAELARETQENNLFLENILIMSRQMRSLIEQLLLLARTDSEAPPSAMEDLDYERLISNTALLYEPVFFEKGLSFAVETEKPVTVHGESDKLRQVLEILLDNAGKYTEKGGEVRLTLERQGERRCLLTVENTGTPLSLEELSQIFQRFYRADKARSRSGSFGLGLSIAENIVHRHKGRIWAESKNGRNCFYVQLPLR